MLVVAAGLWLWAPVEAVIFTAYSVAVALRYRSATLRPLDGLPFASAPKPGVRGTVGLPLMLAILAIGGAFVTRQYFVIFRSLSATVIAALIVAGGAVLLARYTLRSVEVSVMNNLYTLAAGPSRMFQEVTKAPE